MSKRLISATVGLLSLLLGGTLYVFRREETYLSNIVGKYITYEQATPPLIENPFIQGYFPDFLWAVSLCSFLLAIYSPMKLGAWICGVIAALCGIVWEMLQYANVVSGTGDLWDIMIYLSAVILTVILYLKGKRL